MYFIKLEISTFDILYKTQYITKLRYVYFQLKKNIHKNVYIVINTYGGCD